MKPAAATAITNPFPGLRPFWEEEEHLFFGRELQVDAMVDKLAQRRFLAVVGTSGSGKSSLVNCGLRPALHQGRMASVGTSWRMAQFRPGNHPLAALAQALAKDGVLFSNFEERGLPLLEIIDTTLRMGKRGLIDIWEQAALPEDVNLLVVVDQFEELFRYRQLVDAPQADGHGFSEEAAAFVKLLLELQEQQDCPIFVVLTMRSDFLGDCTQFAGLAEAINAGLYLVPRLTPEERRAAIVNPIRVQGAEIEPVLATRLVNDVGDNPDQLSILQHALNRTWANWQQEGGKGPLALRHYEAIGTMAHALDAHAEEAYAELAGTGQEPARRQHLCEKLFQALTDKATDGRGVRRPTTLATLCDLAEATQAELQEVIEVFRDPSRSFLMPPAGEHLTAEKVIDISHESLMRVWERLKRWVEQEAEAAQIYRRLAENASLHARGEASTLRDPELTIYRNWQQKRQPNKAWAERYAAGFDGALEFLRRSGVEHDAELAEKELRQQQEARSKLDEANRARIVAEDRQRLLRRGLMGMGAFALVAVASTVFALSKLDEAKKATAQTFAATAKAQINTDPFEAVVTGLAAMGRLASDTGESIELTATLAKAVTQNWQIGSIPTGQGQVMSLIELKNGELISGGQDGSLRRWRDGKPLGGAVRTGQGEVWSLIELQNGDLISGGSRGGLQRWRDGKPLGDTIPTDQLGILSLIQLRNGDLISGGDNGSLQRWRDGKRLNKAIPTEQGRVWSLIELKNGELISGGENGSLQRWRDGKRIGIATTKRKGAVFSLIELQNGEIVSSYSDGTIQRWRDGKQLGDPIPTGQGQVWSMIELKNGELISGGDDGSMRRWRAGKQLGEAIPTGQGQVLRLIELKNGELISGGSDSSLRRWRPGRPLGEPIPTDQGGILSLIQLRNGDLISVGRNNIKLWRDGKRLSGPIPSGQGSILPGNELKLKNGDLIKGDYDGNLQSWRNGKRLGDAIPTGQGNVQSLVVLRNGELISGGSNGSLRRWRDGKPLGSAIATGQGNVQSLVVLRNGELISGGSNGSLRRWRDGTPLGAAIPTGQSQVLSLIELQNGELISGGSDGSLRRWGDSKTVIDAACRQLREHPALLDPQTAAEKAASATCRNRGYLK
jgi:energy-coupling factor transporter ATP-binding protein EcfA2